jgi:hypothetical protein
MRRFDGAPMIQPILFKSAIYWLCVLVVRLAEGLFHFLAAGGAIADFPEHLVQHFSWPRFLSIQTWLMVLFLIYVTIHELNMLFGDGELFRLFFRWRSSEAKLTRRTAHSPAHPAQPPDRNEPNRSLQRTRLASAR